MAYEVEIGSAPFHIGLVAKSRRGTPLPYPSGLPGPTWSGFDTNIMSYEMDADGLGAWLTPLEQVGSFTVRATIEGFQVTPLDVSTVAETVHHFDIEVTPPATP